MAGGREGGGKGREEETTERHHRSPRVALKASWPHIKLAARTPRDQCKTPTIVTGSPASRSAEADGIFPVSARTGSVERMVNEAGQSEPAWEQLREVEAGEMKRNLYDHNSWQLSRVFYVPDTVANILHVHSLHNLHKVSTISSPLRYIK